MSNDFVTDFSKASFTAHTESHNQFLNDNNVDLNSGGENTVLEDGSAALLGIAVNTMTIEKKQQEGRPTKYGQIYLSPKGMWTVPFVFSVLSHNGVKFVSKFYAAQSEIQQATTLEQYNSLQGNDRFSELNMAILDAQDKQAAYAKIYKGQMQYLKLSESFIPDVISSAKGIVWDDSNASEFNLGDQMFKALDGMEIPVILKKEKDTGYGESNSIKNIIAPFAKDGSPNLEWSEVKAMRIAERKTWIPGDNAESFNTNSYDNQNGAVSNTTSLDEGFGQPSWANQ
ncbi:MAG: hypothetical protein CMD38_07635 [Flavobacteriales bacterium]|nr:hypothetical protein [Flavobacteriales bacterium]|tara:strand:- start:125 stop:979 length:855 start_codon:yes stop_codon:yes gene_type:complete